jgi:3-hydroxy-3-methylglutaryl CoA synthase
MVGITSFGAYVPLHRLDRAELFRAWGGTLGMSVPGERAVASFDEDSVTMAVEAAIDCMHDVNPQSIDGLFFASTTHAEGGHYCNGLSRGRHQSWIGEEHSRGCR